MKDLLTSLLLLASMAIANAQNFTLKSNDLQGQAQMKQVFSSFGCKGQNISPNLSWINPPSGTKSFAITMYDPCAIGKRVVAMGRWHTLTHIRTES